MERTLLSSADVAERIQLCKDMPHATLEDIEVPVGVSPEVVAEYLQIFRKPDGECWLCQERLVSDQHGLPGHTACVLCMATGKQMHHFKDEFGQEVCIETNLQFHPKLFTL